MSDPVEFARVLGLLAEPDHTPTAAESKQQNLELIKFLGTFDLSESELVEDIFWAKFSSLYLPRLIQSYISRPEATHSSEANFLDYTSWITACVGRSYFHHLVRTKPELPLKLHEHVVQTISGLDPKQIAVHPKTGQITATVQILGWLLNLRSLLQDAFQLALSTSVVIPSPSHAALTRLNALLPKIKTLKVGPVGKESNNEVQYLTEYDIKNMASFAQYVEGGLGGGAKAMNDAELEELKTDLPWFRCEAYMEELVDDETCAKGELQKCGRCQTVRYCSRDHQLLHYKKGHKKVCFAPAW